MQKSYRRYGLLALLLIVVAIVCSVIFWPKSGNPNILRHITLDKCIPNYTQNQNPAPCSEVNLDKNYVILKDLNGILQYLLMPTARLDGMESPELLDNKTTNFLWESWQERHFMSDKLGKPIPDSAVSLAINSKYGRTQNHLHIHISCLAPEIRQILDQQAPTINTQWQALPVKLKGEHYIARRATAEEFQQTSPFLMLANEVKGAAEQMGKYSIAIAPINNNDFVILATKHQWIPLNKASSEDIQEHSCKILGL